MDSYQANRVCGCGRCRSRGLMAPAVLITLGALLLLSEWDIVHFHTTWPVLLIVIGLVKVLGSTASTEGHTDYLVQPPASMPPPPTGSTEPPRQEQVDHV